MPAAAAIPDPRTTLARPDLAELALEGLVRAAAYRAVEPMHGRVPVADIRGAADPASDRIDQLLYGEIFDVLDQAGDRLWGRSRRDGVVGWIDADALAPGAPLASQRVGVVGRALPLNALVGDCAEHMDVDDLVPVGWFETDPVAVAERLLGVPHAPGARSSVSTDCAGLVQQALLACGRPGPRYADQQAALGRAVDRARARRGDLAVWLHPEGGPGWSGHSALMLDGERVIHASGDRGAVVIETFAAADARCRADGFAAATFRRL